MTLMPHSSPGKLSPTTDLHDITLPTCNSISHATLHIVTTGLSPSASVLNLHQLSYFPIINSFNAGNQHPRRTQGQGQGQGYLRVTERRVRVRVRVRVTERRVRVRVTSGLPNAGSGSGSGLPQGYRPQGQGQGWRGTTAEHKILLPNSGLRLP
jgi:hypothetical protein